MKEHDYAEVLRWIADGEDVQWQSENGDWEQQSSARVLNEIAQCVYDPERYRKALKMISINGISFPEPMKVRPIIGDTYYVVDATNEDFYCKLCWGDFTSDNLWLARGLCHTTAEAAIMHCKALLSFTEVTK